MTNLTTAPVDADELLFDSEFLRKLERLELIAKKSFAVYCVVSTPQRGAAEAWSFPIFAAIVPVMIFAISTGIFILAWIACS